MPDELRHRWELRVKGDRANVPEIVRTVDRIDVVHYDSDKSYWGRRWFLDTVRESLAVDAILMVDDVRDNFHFRDLVKDLDDWAVFEWNGKYVGLIGPQALMLSAACD